MKRSGNLSNSFREIQVLFSRFYTTVLNEYDITLPQYALLSLLTSSQAIPMTQASKKLHISKPAITNLVDRLEKNNLIKRLEVPEDRRVYLLKALPKGEALVQKIQNRVLPLPLQTLHSFGERDQKIILNFYRILSQNISRTLSEGKKRK